MEFKEFENKKHLLLVMSDLVKMRMLIIDPMKKIKKEEMEEIKNDLIFLGNKVRSFFDRSKELLKIECDIESNNKDKDNIVDDLLVGHSLLSCLIISLTNHLMLGNNIEDYTDNELIEEFKVGYRLYFKSLEVN